MTYLRNFIFAGIALGLAACNPVETIDRAVDCNDLCNRYKDCFDVDYDVDSCRDRCDEMATNDPMLANNCDACLDGHSCVGAFTCAGECSGLLP